MTFFRSKSQERIGEIYALLSGSIFGAFPVVIKLGNHVPPVFYAVVSLFISFLFILAVNIRQGNLKELQNKKAWPLFLGVAVFIIFIPYLLVYRGIQMTSGINAAILEQVEIFFALFYGWLAGEILNRHKIMGGVLMVAGTVVVLFKGLSSFNWGDVLIIIATASYPIGNLYAKKALKIVTPLSILLARSALGFLFLLGVSFIFEPIWQDTDLLMTTLKENIHLFLINGLILLGLSKILWYEALNRLEMSKATILVMIYPVAGVVYASIFLKEIPNIYQVGGLMIVMAGVYLTIQAKMPVVTSAEIG